MSENTERSIGDKAPEEGVPVESAELTVDGVLQGARAMRRAVKIRPNLHLLADMQRLVETIDAAPDGEDVDGLIDEYEKVKADFLASQWWTVEQRTAERRTMVRRETAKRLGFEFNEVGRVTDDDEDRTKESQVEVHVLADHVVEPAGVTAELLTEFHAASPGEFMRLEATITAVQRTLTDEQEQDVLRDFSSRRSGTTPRS